MTLTAFCRSKRELTKLFDTYENYWVEIPKRVYDQERNKLPKNKRPKFDGELIRTDMPGDPATGGYGFHDFFIRYEGRSFAIRALDSTINRLTNELKNKFVFVCPKCKSTNVDAHVWANVNTNEVSGACDEENMWCNTCEEIEGDGSIYARDLLRVYFDQTRELLQGKEDHEPLQQERQAGKTNCH